MKSSKPLLIAGVTGLRVGAFVLTLIWCVQSGHWPLVILAGLLLWEQWDLARRFQVVMRASMTLVQGLQEATLAMLQAAQSVPPPAQPAEPDLGQPQWVAPGHVGPKGES